MSYKTMSTLYPTLTEALFATVAAYIDGDGHAMISEVHAYLEENTDEEIAHELMNDQWGAPIDTDTREPVTMTADEWASAVADYRAAFNDADDDRLDYLS